MNAGTRVVTVVVGGVMTASSSIVTDAPLRMEPTETILVKVGQVDRGRESAVVAVLVA